MKKPKVCSSTTIVLFVYLLCTLFLFCESSLGLTVPNNCTATAVSSNRIDLSWKDNDTDVVGYKIYRDDVQFDTLLHSGDPTQMQIYVDLINVAPGTQYGYKISAYDNMSTESDKSSEVFATTENASQELTVFPNAQGFGIYTVAGRGGRIFYVKSLADDGEDNETLRECIEASGPRVCVFEVSGYIELNSLLEILNPYITIAGQTAPPPGITLSGGSLFRINTHDVLIQHIRSRPGDDINGYSPGQRDGISVYGPVEARPYNIIIDHCSVSWAIDGGIDMYGYYNTISNCIISEGLHNSIDPKGPHSMGTLLTQSDNATIINNLYAHNSQRNPRIGGDRSVVANNVIYNPQPRAMQTSTSGIRTSVVGNIVIRGSNSSSLGTYAVLDVEDSPDNATVFVSNNECENKIEGDPWSCVYDRNDEDAKEDEIRSFSPPAWVSPLFVHSSSEVTDLVLDNVGAFPAARDSVDERIIEDVQKCFEQDNCTGKIVDCVDEENILLNSGTVQSASQDNSTVQLDSSASSVNTAYIQKLFIITAGKGSGQERKITNYDGSTKIATVDQALNPKPDSTSTYQIYVDCTNNAGGWPNLANNSRTLYPPDNPQADDDSDGYTNLEEWLHGFAWIVEGALQDTDSDGIADDGDKSGTAGDNPCTGGVKHSCDDNCPNDDNANQSDTDNDTVGDECDNCLNDPNADQEDIDSDGIGDVCDADTYTIYGQVTGDQQGSVTINLYQSMCNNYSLLYSTTTDGSGNYSFTELGAGTYKVEAEYDNCDFTPINYLGIVIPRSNYDQHGFVSNCTY